MLTQHLTRFELSVHSSVRPHVPCLCRGKPGKAANTVQDKLPNRHCTRQAVESTLYKTSCRINTVPRQAAESKLYKGKLPNRMQVNQQSTIKI